MNFFIFILKRMKILLAGVLLFTSYLLEAQQVKSEETVFRLNNIKIKEIPPDTISPEIEIFSPKIKNNKCYSKKPEINIIGKVNENLDLFLKARSGLNTKFVRIRKNK